MSSLIDAIIDGIFNNFTNKVNAFIIDTFTTLITLLNTLTIDIWSDEYILGMIEISRSVSFTVLGLSIVFLLKDIKEQSGKVDYKIVFLSLVKGFFFATTIHYLAGYIFIVAQEFVNSLNLYIDPSEVANMETGLLDILGITNVNMTIQIILLIVVLVAFIAFFISTIMSVSSVFILIISSFIYVPFVVRGDTSKVSEWYTSLASISITYILRYVFFYLGIFMMLEKRFSSIIVFTAVFILPKTLQKFGYSSGTGNALSKATTTISSTFNSARGVFIK